jgi:hypothetical protein
MKKPLTFEEASGRNEQQTKEPLAKFVVEGSSKNESSKTQSLDLFLFGYP